MNERPDIEAIPSRPTTVPPPAWRESKAWSNAEARAALNEYEGVVQRTARRLRRAAAFGRALDEDDLCAEGRIAVLEALATYRGYGAAKATWVRVRVRQRMIDAIRRMDSRSRDEVRAAFRPSLLPSTCPPRPCVGVRRIVSLDATTPELEALVHRVPDTTARMADEVVHERKRALKFRTALSNLPSRQREAIELGIFEGLLLAEIGTRLGVSESRVCQLQKRAVETLRAVVRDSVRPPFRTTEI